MDEVKKIIARFIQISPTEIGPETAIDKIRLRSSILIHRMYAEIAAVGFKIDNYSTISTYSDLVSRISGKSKSAILNHSVEKPRTNLNETFEGIGIDIEEILKFPETNDYRSHEFYKANFTTMEISYCILKENSRQSFAGLFSAKEAIRKCNLRFLNLPLIQIEIIHSNLGQPIYPGFYVSISHNESTSVAVALMKVTTDIIEHRLEDLGSAEGSTESKFNIENGRRTGFVVSFIALIVAIMSLIVALLK